MFGRRSASYQGYAGATTFLQRPAVEWKGESISIQKDGIHDDFGVFDSPDDFFVAHGTDLSGIKKFFTSISSGT